jgi:hypothetical protein
VQRWRAVFLEMQRQFADVGANAITEDAARSWVRGLVSEERLRGPEGRFRECPGFDTVAGRTMTSEGDFGVFFLVVQAKRERSNGPNGRNDMKPSEAPASDPKEPEETFGWKTAITYGLISLVMLSLAASAFVEQRQAAFQQSKAEHDQQQAERAFVEELASLLTKREALRGAQSQVETLGREIQDLPSVSVQDKARLAGTVGTIAGLLNDIDSQIDIANQKLTNYLINLRTRADAARSSDLTLSFIGVAHAQGQNVITPQIKLGFAGLAFALIASVMGYCLWMIGRPVALNASKQAITALTADKKWAKELLNKQLVFLGGLVVGIVIK